MEQETVQLVLGKLDGVIKSVGGKLGEFYPYAVRQQTVEGMIFVLATVLVVSILVAGIIWTIKHWEKLTDDDMEGVALGVITFLGIVSFVLTIISMSDGIPRLLNPHFYAVENLL